MMRQPAAQEQAWILDSLFLGPDRRHRRIGSLIVGLLGPFLFAIASCAVVGLFAPWVESIGSPNSASRHVAGVVTFLLASGSYFASLITLHLYASCQLPLSIRLAMIYVTIFFCWTAAVLPSGGLVTSAQVLSTVPLCVGGFLLRWLRGWRAQSWNQPIAKSKVTIFSLLDVTTAIAMTLGLISLEQEFYDPRGFACMLPVLAAFGLHVWARLTSISPIRHDAGTGFGIWMAVNILWAFLVFVSFAVGFSTSPAGLLGFIAAPCSLLVAHVWTEIPLRWLRGCGWAMVRVNDLSSDTVAPDETGWSVKPLGR